MITGNIISKYPKLYHMADNDSWLNIKKHGLLSTSALLDKWEYTGLEREIIECKHRPEMVPIYHRVYGKAVIRDQKAMRPERLKKCLPKDITVEGWCRFINNKVFFWASWKGLKMFIAANEYIYKPHLVITIDTKLLLQRYVNKITLSSINSGSTFAKKDKVDPEPRSHATFKKIPDYNVPWINELAVDYGILDVLNFVVGVDRYRANRKGDEPQKLEEV